MKIRSLGYFEGNPYIDLKKYYSYDKYTLGKLQRKHLIEDFLIEKFELQNLFFTIQEYVLLCSPATLRPTQRLAPTLL